MRLKCDPDTEADTFDNGGLQSNVATKNAEMTVPIVFFAGRGPRVPPRPAVWAPAVAEGDGRRPLRPRARCSLIRGLTRPADVAA